MGLSVVCQANLLLAGCSYEAVLARLLPRPLKLDLMLVGFQNLDLVAALSVLTLEKEIITKAKKYWLSSARAKS